MTLAGAKTAALLLIILPLVTTATYAQDEKSHPIDGSLGACIDKDPSTAGMVECLGKAYDMWDKELNRVYTDLARKLSPPARASLKTAQLEWIKYRDAEFKFLDSLYSGLQGTMYIPMNADARMQIVKKRALELQNYLDLLRDHR